MREMLVTRPANSSAVKDVTEWLKTVGDGEGEAAEQKGQVGIPGSAMQTPPKAVYLRN